jgi:hypothetical protein
MSFENRELNKVDARRACSPRSRLSQRANTRRFRGQRGGQIAEFGPALLILLVVMFFPMIDLLYYGFAYGAAWYLHQLEVRAVSVSQPPFGPNQTFDGRSFIPELAAKETAFLQSGLGKFLQIQDVFCQVTQLPDPANPAVVGNSVLTNQFFVQAMIVIPIPYFAGAPALNGGGAVFTYTTSVLQEEKGLN